MCYASYSNLDPKMYYAPNLDIEICHTYRNMSCLRSKSAFCTKSRSRNVSCIRSRMCYATNSYFKMYNAPNLDLEICHASNPNLHYAPNPDLENVSCTKSRSRNVSCIRSIMCYAPNSDLKMCHATKLTDPSLLVHANISYK
jgi:hypothetical protein